MFDKEQIEKIETLDNLLNSIKNKTATVSSQTKFLKSFNNRLETLLMCFKAYSIEEKDPIYSEENTIETIKNTKENKNNRNMSIKQSKGDYKTSNNEKNFEHKTKEDSIEEIKRFKIEYDFNSIIDKLFITNPVSKLLAINILELIKARGSISLDDLVKSIKSSKYKVIDALNILIKEKVIVKSFEKGFVYRISKEII